MKLKKWLRSHLRDLAVVTAILAVAGTVSAVNMTNYPQRFEDEGTYVSQAWAVEHTGRLAHYTYWYDHPPVAWIQIAGNNLITNATDRYDSSISAGREFMLLAHVVSVLLIYALARRLGIGIIAAGIGTLLYALSPLAVIFSRFVFLDNVALPWLLGAFLLALSPRRHLVTAIFSAVCMAIAVLSKETYLALLPVLVYGLWTTSDKRNRRYMLTIFSVVFFMISSFYVLYAALKGELFPGEGHVSLLGTFFWQLFGRGGSGSILSSTSDTRGLVNFWLDIDHWLLLLGALALPFALFIRKLRVVALALLVSLILLLRTGYLPFPYVIVVLPFAAITLAGVLHYLVIKPLATNKTIWRRSLAGIGLAAFSVVLIGFTAPDWKQKLSDITTVDQDASSRQAIAWVEQNVPRDKRLVVESALWTDLESRGFNQPGPIWLYKTETDPEVTKQIGGWQGIDYLVLNGPTLGASNFSSSFPTVSQAITNAKVIQEFGADNQKIIIFEVQH
jgi:hypothetical protein